MSIAHGVTGRKIAWIDYTLEGGHLELLGVCIVIICQIRQYQSQQNLTLLNHSIRLVGFGTYGRVCIVDQIGVGERGCLVRERFLHRNQSLKSYFLHCDAISLFFSPRKSFDS